MAPRSPSPFPVSSHYRSHQSQAQPAQPQSRGVPQGQAQPVPVHPEVYPPSSGATVSYGAPQARSQQRQVLMAGGAILALAALIMTPKLTSTPVPEAAPFTCLRQEQPQALVSRDQIKRLLETEPQTPKATVLEILNQPYCVLSAGQTEAGLPAEREAYPLEFDPQTWLVVLYAGDRYVGYDFRFR
ncbi:hypothetical protein [Nodosilinea sp. E11]|uniref:hypothetical protein n=1 Tax=Nodosilinea sp. E11 TaxID=3037479 RepID=UPI002934EA93|nr:hypothetical protein [Nodosilinea sp. E11]WOD38498.1 hypothetical protein RRF56_20005 [Nodosilinea sp. E11]